MSDERQTFLATGCASGIGRRLAEVLVERGQRVVATDVDSDTLAQHAEACGWDDERVRVRGLDVRDAAAWSAIVDETVAAFGRLDVLINCAGYLRCGTFLETEPAELERQVDVNAKGVMLGTHAAAKVMVEQGAGHIINVASFAALGPVPGITIYCGSKYAVRGFSLAVAQELRPHGVSVTVVSPESVLTPMLEMESHYDTSAMAFAARRLLSVDEVAELILGRVLDRRPLEARLPRVRGMLARLLDVFPRTTAWLFVPGVRRKGLERQRELRGEA